MGRNKTKCGTGRKQLAGPEKSCNVYRRWNQVREIWDDAERLGMGWDGGWGGVLKGGVNVPEEGCIVTKLLYVVWTRLTSLGWGVNTSTSASHNKTSNSGRAQPRQDASHPTAGYQNSAHETPLLYLIIREATKMELQPDDVGLIDVWTETCNSIF